MNKSLLFFLLMFIFISCTRQLIEPKLISLGGRVSVQGQSDFSGVKIELYETAKLDTAITNQLARYPNVGLALEKQLLFDHRLVVPSFTTATDADGNYIFNDIPDGQYNLVAEKAGYGWRYLLNVDGAATLPEIKLFREMTISGAIETYTVWPADQHVIVSGNLIIREGSTLLIDKGCVVRMGGDYKIEGDGAIQVNGTAEDMVWFTANVPSKEPGFTAWRGITANGQATIDYARIDFAENGIKTARSEFSIQYSLVSKVGDIGMWITRESTGLLSNNVFLNCPIGVKVEGNSYAEIAQSIFNNSADSPFGAGIRINASRATATDNIINGFELGFVFEFNTYGDFLYNYVDNCETGVFINKASFTSTTPVVVRSNILKNCTNTVIDIFNCDSPIVEYNNFSQPGAGKFITGYAVLYTETKAVSYPNNYWGMTETNDVLRRVDVQDNDSATHPYAVYIDPVATQPIRDAGPR